MTVTASRIIESTLRRSPLQFAARRASRNGLVVLAYHDVPDAESFAAHLDHLLENHRPVGLDDVVSALTLDVPLPDHAVLVTFDDGDRSVLDVAAPLMRDRGIRGVAFAIVDAVVRGEPFWWDEVEALVVARGSSRIDREPDASNVLRRLKQISDDSRLQMLDDLRRSVPSVQAPSRSLDAEDLRALQRSGIEIGNHTLSHPCLPHCGAEKVEREIRQAHGALTKIIGRPPRAFAYPNGDFDPRAEQVISDLGYTTGFLFDHRVATTRQNPLRLSRVRIDSGASVDRLAIIVSGLHTALLRARGRV